MNIALICGNNHAGVLNRVKSSVGANVDSYPNISSMVGTQKPYVYDRVVITSQAFEKDKDSINREAKCLNSYKKNNSSCSLVFAIHDKDSNLAHALASAFASPSCCVISIGALGIPDLTFLMEGAISDFGSKYNVVEPIMKTRQRQHTQQVQQPTKAVVPVKKK